MTTLSHQNSAEDNVLGSVSTTLSHATTLTDGGYDYELLGSPDSRYECPICLLYLRDPVLTTCGHRFCSGCISQWLIKEGGKCPVDGGNLSHENIFPDNYTKREIMQYKAKCPFVKHGCEVVLCLMDLERHIQSEHMEPPNSSPSSKLNNGSPTSSNGMVDCLYKEVGCAGYFPQEQLQRHFETDVHHHLQLLTAAYKRLKVYSSRPSLDYGSPPPEHFWRQDSRESTRWLLADETMDSDDSQLFRQKSWDSVRFARKQNWKPRHPDRLAESDESLCHKPSENCEKSGQNGAICLAGPSPSPSTMKTTTSFDFKDMYERLVRLEQNDREKQIKIDRLECRLSSAVNLFSKVTKLMDDLTARYCNGFFVWKIPAFKNLCQEFRRTKARCVNSPGFYTETFGYKLCLRFNLTTFPVSSGSIATAEIPIEQDEDIFFRFRCSKPYPNTHVCLYIHFMQGEFDDTLHWPFSGEIKMGIIHPTSPESSLMETLRSKPDAVAFAKPKLPRSMTGIGYSEFCPLNKIFSSGFVKDDTLTCQVLAKFLAKPSNSTCTIVEQRSQ